MNEAYKTLPDFRNKIQWLSKLGYRRVDGNDRQLRKKKLQDFLAAMLNKFQAKATLTKKKALCLKIAKNVSFHKVCKMSLFYVIFTHFESVAPFMRKAIFAKAALCIHWLGDQKRSFDLLYCLHSLFNLCFAHI